MKLDTSYKNILAISIPIMLGSAVQNVIALSDSVFLYYYDEVYKIGDGEFASIGFVGVFYLVIAAIGYGFSRGGQIMIARHMGEEKPEEVGRTFYAMTYFEFALALLMFLFMTFGCSIFFAMFVDSQTVYDQSLEYIHYRSWGVFFSYVGVSIVALYSGIARTSFIIIDTIILAIVNIILNYALIFGRWGLPEMGIGGAGLASSIAEAVAFVVFIVYIFFDKKVRSFNLFRLPEIDFELIKKQFNIAAPIVAQSVVGLGSWFFFFGIVENLGQRELAITNLVRMIYLVLSIPTWGLCSGINTLVSNFIGQGRNDQILNVTWKTAKLCFFMTALITIPIIVFPKYTLYPLLGAEDMSLIGEAQTTFYVLGGILAMFSIGAVYFNALVGTGATFEALKIQFVCAIFYVLYIYFIINSGIAGLEFAWASEIFYWVVMLGVAYWYLTNNKWQKSTLN